MQTQLDKLRSYAISQSLCPICFRIQGCAYEDRCQLEEEDESMYISMTMAREALREDEPP